MDQDLPNSRPQTILGVALPCTSIAVARGEFVVERLRSRAKYVRGPDGSPLNVNDLPAPGTTRWVIRRKAEIVAAVRGGLLPLEEACARYLLTVDEFLAWRRSVDRHGLPGLRVTRAQKYRDR